ncbi:MAG: arginine--tRNA ligase [Turicibacter sp.]
MIQTLKENLKQEIKAAVVKCGYLSENDSFDILLENSKDASHGDYSTNVAMQLTKLAKKNPRMIAEELLSHFNSEAANVTKVEIAGPGFINFFIDQVVFTKAIKSIIELNEKFGESKKGNGLKYNVEYVSANPTGDLHLGHARGAALGDTLCRILFKAGYDVTREYYVNDAGNQIHNLVISAYARYLQALGLDAQMPEAGYHGPDIISLGKLLVDQYGDQFVNKLDENYKLIREVALNYELDKIKQDLKMFGVEFDMFTSEQALYDQDLVKQSIDLLKEKGYIFEEDGAVWFKSTAFGDDKDRVLQKSDGSFTYLTPDIANHIEKLKRGNDKLVDIWGADHHGYIARVKASMQALGHEADKLEVDIIQMVRLIKDGEEFKMSKRTGKAVTIRELVDEVGVDAVRYFFVMRSGETQMDFDLDLATKKSNENPVYYAQYAYARTCSILRQAEEKGFNYVVQDKYDFITHEKEFEVLKVMGDFPIVIADAAAKRKPHIICNYINDLATAFHSLYNAEKVINEENVQKTNEKLALIKALQLTMRNALDLIGVTAPERM